MSAGDPETARRWWRRSRAAAIASADNHLIAYVTSRQAVQGLYGAYSPSQVIVLADKALSATSAPCTGRMSALNAKAQALAMLGREKAANETLTTLERTFEHLPRDITREKLSALGWPEERLHHGRSYCATFSASSAAGEVARAEALRLTADADWRSRTQLKLHRAAAEADAHDAVATLSDLSDAQRRDRFVRMIAARALASCESRDGPSAAGVAELREVLSAA
jgi:hypothetical protein